jgi:PAS domain-containing protein
VRQDGEVALSAALRGQAGRFPGRSVMPGQPMQYWDNLLTPLLDPEGRPTAVLCVSREVTAEHAARESLRESEERLAIAARVGGLGIWDYDIVNDRLYCDEILVPDHGPRHAFADPVDRRVPAVHPSG